MSRQVLQRHDQGILSLKYELPIKFSLATAKKKLLRAKLRLKLAKWKLHFYAFVTKQSKNNQNTELWPLPFIYLCVAALLIIATFIATESESPVINYVRWLLSILYLIIVASLFIVLKTACKLIQLGPEACNSIYQRAKVDHARKQVMADSLVAATRAITTKSIAKDKASKSGHAIAPVKVIYSSDAIEIYEDEVSSDDFFATYRTEKRNFWKNLTGEQWKQFICSLLIQQGLNVVTIPTSGDLSLDLVVDLGNEKIAIQAKGNLCSVGNKSVQEAYAGMFYYKCTHCAVITNRIFNECTIELAKTTNCFLLSEKEVENIIQHGFLNTIECLGFRR